MRGLVAGVCLLLAVPIAASSQPQPVCPLMALAPAEIEGAEQFVVVGQPRPCPPANRTWGDFTVTTDFGDGTIEETPFRDQDALWTVGGNHVYRRAGTYELVATLTDEKTGEQQVLRRPIEVPNAPLRARRSRTLSFRAGHGARRTIARFADGNRLAVPGDHRASIGWGDGTRSKGSIAKHGGEFVVRAAPGYRRPGTYRVTIRISDDRGATLRIRTRAVVD